MVKTAGKVGEAGERASSTAQVTAGGATILSPSPPFMPYSV
jgi:hypothetical protein